MSSQPSAGAPVPEVAEASKRRGRRAAVARRLLAKAADAAATLDWDTLDRAPEWLALREAALAAFERRVGALLCAPALRLWIDGPRIAAARAALGDAFLRALLAEHDKPAVDAGAPAPPRLQSAERVATLLQAAGAGVLLASLPAGPLRRAATGVLSAGIPLTMVPELAQALVARTWAIAAQCDGVFVADAQEVEA